MPDTARHDQEARSHADEVVTGASAPVLGTTRPIVVLSVPSGPPAVRHLTHPTEPDPIRRLPDPGEPWWPPSVLDRDWVREHADEFDLMHVHSDYDTVDPSALDALGHELRRLSKPLVVTVQDLRNPHHRSAELHDRQLRALLGHATEILTLTPRAAHLIQEGYGHRAEVIPHPHVVELGEMRRRQAHARPPSHVVGLHFGSLGPNTVTTELVDAVLTAVRKVPGTELRVDVHRDVTAPDHRRHDPALMSQLHQLDAAGALRLEAHDHFDDDALVDYLASLHASVLPYRFGTHSSWLEACRDLGVAVIAPDCGAFDEQGPVFGFCCNERRGFDPDSCARAVESALREPRPEPVHWKERQEERSRTAMRHAAVYRRALEGLRCVRPADGVSREGPGSGNGR